jgi:hypothetical protein
MNQMLLELVKTTDKKWAKKGGEVINQVERYQIRTKKVAI